MEGCAAEPGSYSGDRNRRARVDDPGTGDAYSGESRPSSQCPTGRDRLTVYSHSRLASFETCPKKYEYRYVQKLEVTRESVEAFVGKRVHEILERLYHHVGRYQQPPSLRQVLDRFQRDWRLRWHDDIEIVREGQSADEYLSRGERCLQNYYRKHYPFDAGETVGIEQRVSLQLDDGGRYRLRGVVDRIVRTAPGRFEVHDYKTGAWLPSQQRIDEERQLALYQIGIEQTYEDVQSVGLVWHYLQHNKTLRSERSPETLDRLKASTIELIDRIEAAEQYPPRPGKLCSWCEYREICPAVADATDDAADVTNLEPPPPADRDAPPPFLDAPIPVAAAPMLDEQRAPAELTGRDAADFEGGQQLELL
jgi:putative RecB family exonuclease